MNLARSEFRHEPMDQQGAVGASGDEWRTNLARSEFGARPRGSMGSTQRPGGARVVNEFGEASSRHEPTWVNGGVLSGPAAHE
jgi:hypothetical protein